jgi:hypothetical protein
LTPLQLDASGLARFVTAGQNISEAVPTGTSSPETTNPQIDGKGAHFGPWANPGAGHDRLDVGAANIVDHA